MTRPQLLFIGPFPPPVHGQARVTQLLYEQLLASGLTVHAIDTGDGGRSLALSAVLWRTRQHMRAARCLLFAPAGAVYLSLNSRLGMWLSLGLVVLARLRGRRLFVHHHSYAHVRRRRLCMAWIARVGGNAMRHLVLGDDMANLLRQTTPEVRHTFVLDNAGFVDPDLLSQVRQPYPALRLGHLGNLTRDKGVEDVLELSYAAKQQGLPVELHLAGPLCDDDLVIAVERTRSALGENLHFWGAVDQKRKRDFFANIDVFLFPSRRTIEAAPLVLLEAMAAGVPVIAVGTAEIPAMLSAQGGIAIPVEQNYVLSALAYLIQWRNHPLATESVRQRYRRLRDEFLRQYDEVQELMGARIGDE